MHTAHAHSTCTQHMHTSHETTVFSDGSCADKMLHAYSTHRRNIHNSYTHIHKPYIPRTTHINFKCDRTRHDRFFSKTQAKFQKRFNCYSVVVIRKFDLCFAISSPSCTRSIRDLTVHVFSLVQLWQ